MTFCSFLISNVPGYQTKTILCYCYYSKYWYLYPIPWKYDARNGFMALFHFFIQRFNHRVLNNKYNQVSIAWLISCGTTCNDATTIGLFNYSKFKNFHKQYLISGRFSILKYDNNLKNDSLSQIPIDNTNVIKK